MERDETTAKEKGCKSKGFLTSADALASFGADLFDEAKVNRLVLDALHPCGPCCPDCGADVPVERLDRFYSLFRMKCSICSRFFSGTTGTILYKSQLSPVEFYIIAVLSSCDKSAKEISDLVRQTTETVRVWMVKLEVDG